ncbi:hypothetical protein GOB94_14455 [Granulicella sp. 5B5]|uniref:DUF6644 family protein n=1 Tax=Granulicella sp. 5B5 TaxID=1617967 RepID=UPI0015F77CC1|nr:DUF6644 family protein [Granulicella sp. 5B5]QMV19763.1 hypothetical protein GOB94_14455 [Granulicella sp. 5B5]
MSPRPWFVALAHSPLGHFMQTSQWAFAIVEMAHLLALALLGGSVLIVDLRLLGVVLKRDSAVVIGRDMSRILLSSLVFMILSGIAMVSEESLKCFYSPAFRWKMALLFTAVLFYFTLHRRALYMLGTRRATVWSRMAAGVSIALWLGVGIAGRAIGLI